MNEQPILGEAAGDSLEELYEEAPCGYLTTAADGTILRANRTLVRWCGYTSDELVGRRRFSDLLPTGAKIYYETHYAPLLQMQHHVREIALELVRADGSRLPVIVNASAKTDADGRLLLVRVTLFDASERRRYERELLQARAGAEARAAAATALSHVADGVVLVDDDGVVVVLNPAAERLFSIAAPDAVGRRLAALVPGWDVVTGRIATAPAVVPLTLGGATRWLDVTAAPAPAGVVYTLRDVTEERRLEQIRDDIVAIVSHELRTPLAGVLGAAQTLVARGEELPPDTRRAFIGMIAEQATRLAGIVEEILLTQRLDTGALEVERREFDVVDVVRRVVAAAEQSETTHLLHVEGPAEIEAEGDPALFEQVVRNLLENAVKYSPPGSEVRLAVERRHGSVRLTVADEGPGIAEADRERVFEKFLRLDPTQLSGASGTGLGLYIVRELVRRMRGRVGVLDSERGTVFHVDLPPAQR